MRYINIVIKKHGYFFTKKFLVLAPVALASLLNHNTYFTVLHEQIKNKIKEAMMAKDNVSLETYRGMLAAFTNDLVAKNRKPSEILTDDEALSVIARLVKQRKDSIEQYTKGKRDDLVKEETAQLRILEIYLPKMMDRGEIEKIAKNKKEELSINDIAKKGMLMSALMKDLKGRADGTLVKEIVDSLF